jgi:hypothetical protein
MQAAPADSNEMSTAAAQGFDADTLQQTIVDNSAAEQFESAKTEWAVQTVYRRPGDKYHALFDIRDA